MKPNQEIFFKRDIPLPFQGTFQNYSYEEKEKSMQFLEFLYEKKPCDYEFQIIFEYETFLIWLPGKKDKPNNNVFNDAKKIGFTGRCYKNIFSQMQNQDYYIMWAGIDIDDYNNADFIHSLIPQATIRQSKSYKGLHLFFRFESPVFCEKGTKGSIVKASLQKYVDILIENGLEQYVCKHDGNVFYIFSENYQDVLYSSYDFIEFIMPSQIEKVKVKSSNKTSSSSSKSSQEKVITTQKNKIPNKEKFDFFAKILDDKLACDFDLEEAGDYVRKDKEEKIYKKIYKVGECPFNFKHENANASSDFSIFLNPNGGIEIFCFHKSCREFWNTKEKKIDVLKTYYDIDLAEIEKLFLEKRKDNIMSSTLEITNKKQKVDSFEETELYKESEKACKDTPENKNFLGIGKVIGFSFKELKKGENTKFFSLSKFTDKYLDMVEKGFTVVIYANVKLELNGFSFVIPCYFHPKEDFLTGEIKNVYVSKKSKFFNYYV